MKFMNNFNYNNNKMGNSNTGIYIGVAVIIIIFVVLIGYLMYYMMQKEYEKEQEKNIAPMDLQASFDLLGTITDEKGPNEAVYIEWPDKYKEFYKMGEYVKDGWKVSYDGKNKINRTKKDKDSSTSISWDFTKDTKGMKIVPVSLEEYEFWANINKYKNRS